MFRQFHSAKIQIARSLLCRCLKNIHRGTRGYTEVYAEGQRLLFIFTQVRFLPYATSIAFADWYGLDHLHRKMLHNKTAVTQLRQSRIFSSAMRQYIFGFARKRIPCINGTDQKPCFPSVLTTTEVFGRRICMSVRSRISSRLEVIYYEEDCY